MYTINKASQALQVFELHLLFRRRDFLLPFPSPNEIPQGLLVSPPCPDTKGYSHGHPLRDFDSCG